MSEENKRAARLVPEPIGAERSAPLDSSRLSRLLNLTPSVIYATDILKGNACTFVSENVKELMGYRPDQMVIESNFWYGHIHSDDRDQVLSDCETAIRQGSGCLEYRFKRHDGTYRWIEDRFRVLYDDSGRAVEVVGHWSDISDRKRIELALRASHATVERHGRQIGILAEMNDHLHVCDTIHETKGVLSYFLHKLFPHDSGAIFIFNQSRSMLELIAAWGNLDGTLDVFSQDDCWALRQGKPHFVNGNAHPLTCAHIENSGKGLSLCVPMIAQSDVMGLLLLRGGAITRKTIRDSGDTKNDWQGLAVNASKQLALSLMNLRLRDTLKLQTLKDPLTQLYNRRFLTEYLDKELIKCRRNGTILGVFMIDVDHFKQYNDLYGHDAGDAVLQKMGEYMKKSVRASDVACRYGGEEFVILLPEVTHELLQERAETFRLGVKSLHVTHREEQLGTITVSVGVAVYPNHSDSPASFIAAADKALYRAKKEGRDRVVFADGDSTI